MTILVYDNDGKYVCEHTGSEKNMLLTKKRLERLDYTVEIKPEDNEKGT